MSGRGQCIGKLLLMLTLLLAAQPAGAGVLHMEPDYEKTEIKATVAEPFGIARDHPTATGSFQLIKGDIDGDPQNPAATGHVKLVINATTYDSGSDARDRAVLGAALETAKYQMIIFDSTGVEDVKIDAPGVSGSATIVGNLTLHGTTRVMRVPVRVALSTDGQFSADGEVTFRYTDFGVKRPRFLFVAPAGDEVTIAFRVVAQRPGAPAAATQSRRGPAVGRSASDQLAAGQPVR
jgi:polyisoprenoid-binding protein YceI